MNETLTFNEVHSKQDIESLKDQWLKTLSSPQDGMWESFREHSKHWVIKDKKKLIGYACVNDNNQLLQFYITPKYFSDGATIFKTFITANKINKGIVGTNNPVYLSMTLNLIKSFKINTYLFRDNHEVNIKEKEGSLNKGQAKDLNKIVDFCHESMGTPKEWLVGYIGNLIEQGEIFYFENKNILIGTCEVRNSLSAPAYADIGMVISPKFRKQGYGTYLLYRAKLIAQGSGKTSICSCEKENIGSFKSISNCGFISLHQLLSIDLQT